MNKAYRTVWSEARQSFIVAHENARGRGKPSSPSRTVLARSITAAVLALGAVPAMAQTVIGSPTSNGNPAGYSLSGGESLVNNSVISGTSGYPGVLVTTGVTAGSITNHGTITSPFPSSDSSTLTGILVNYGTVAGGITNSDPSSLINGGLLGIAVINTGASVSGGITNNGTISGGDISEVTSGGIYIANHGHVSGGITNNIGGVISGQQAILLEGGTLDFINNSGTLAGASVGIGVEGGSSMSGAITNSAGATISGAIGIGISTSTISGGITNAGKIVAAGDFGILLSASSVAGGITNSAGGTISGAAGIFLQNSTVSGGVVNAGSISGAQYGIVAGGVSISGGITNSHGGVISGASALSLWGDSLDYISNAGTIMGVNGNPYGGTAGIGLQGSTLTGGIANSGLISGAGAGISLLDTTKVAGGITNSGTIVGASEGILVAGLGTTLTGGITNSGSITGSGQAGIVVERQSGVGGAITNSGRIAGALQGIIVTGAGSSIAGVRNVGGTISGGVTGIAIVANSTISGGILNAGVRSSISGGKTGVAVQQGGVLSGGLTNSGTIQGSEYAVNASPSSLPVVQGESTARLPGDAHAPSADAQIISRESVLLGGITILGANTAKFLGDVLAPSAGVTVASGATFTGSNAFAVQSFTVADGAHFNMGVMASTVQDNSGITVTQGVTNAGTLSVARDVTANITGDYTQAATGIFEMGAASTKSYSKLVVSGNVTLPSAAKINVDVVNLNTLGNGETLTGVISGATLSASTFKVTDNSDLFTFTGHEHGDRVDLVIASNALVLHDVKLNGNEPAEGAAATLDHLIALGGTGSMSPVITALGKLQTSQQVSAAVTQTLPLLTGASPAASSGFLTDMNRVVQARVDANHGLSAGDDFLTDSNVWLKPFGSWADQSARDGVAGFKANVGGLGTGLDSVVSESTRVGVALVVANADVSGTSSMAPAGEHVDLYQFVGYGSTSLDAQTDLNYQLDVGTNTTTGQRQIELTDAVAKSFYDAYTAHAGMGIGRTIPLSEESTLTPSLRTDYTWIRDDAYAETGAGALNLHVGSQSYEQLITSASAKFSQKVRDDTSLFASLGLGYDSLARQASITAAYAGAPGQSFATPGITEKPWMTMGGLGVLFLPKTGPEITVRYDVDKREGFTDQSVSMKLRWSF